jgi:hypothetical protein
MGATYYFIFVDMSTSIHTVGLPTTDGYGGAPYPLLLPLGYLLRYLFHTERFYFCSHFFSQIKRKAKH